VFYLRHSSNWNPHRLHSEPFPPKENHNVGLLRFDDDHDHICYRFAQVQIFGGKSNVFKSLQVSEKVVLAYFAEQSEKLKPSSLWCRYSMLRTMVSIKIKIDISQYHQVVAFLKRKSEGYRPKKSCIFCKEEIHQFLKEMNDKDFLFMKVNWS
jgi:hypothetical protein